MFELTSRGYYHAHGRADDTMNIGGIKVHIFLLKIEHIRIMEVSVAMGMDRKLSFSPIIEYI